MGQGARSSSDFHQQQPAAQQRCSYDTCGELYSKLAAEFIGTFVLVVGVACNSLNSSATWAPVAVGSLLGGLYYAFGHVSGAHFNPAVTLGAYLTQAVDAVTAGGYILVQVLAGILAGAVYTRISHKPWILAPDGGYGHEAIVIVEFVYTFMLLFVFLNMMDSRRASEFAGLAVGLALVAGAYGGGSITGAALNPAVVVGADVAAHIHRDGQASGVAGYYIGAELAAGLVAGWFMGLIRPRSSSVGAYCTPFTSRVLCEFVASFFVALTVGFNVTVMSKGAAMAMGASLASMALAVVDISGACISPAITLSLLLSRSYPFSVLPSLEAIVFIVAQCSAALAAGVLWTATTNKGFGLGPGAGYSLSEAENSELLFTGLISLVAIASTKHPKAQMFYPLAIGLTYMASANTMGPISGASLNPAVSLAVAASSFLKEGPWQNVGAYIVYEVWGAVLAPGIALCMSPSTFGRLKESLSKAAGVIQRR
eukprot:TRINITY_DN80481_c0_g1_i1.p1 TRINITY_DN80481_c0_g1~~TRINITY_DN80481_c0_g1_i1.p1  ORF type:complete len:483 (+),score=89.37 TRINITY_DN80481_c0_g1_i1:125-1573(+)